MRLMVFSLLFFSFSVFAECKYEDSSACITYKGKINETYKKFVTQIDEKRFEVRLTGKVKTPITNDRVAELVLKKLIKKEIMKEAGGEDFFNLYCQEVLESETAEAFDIDTDNEIHYAESNETMTSASMFFDFSCQ